MQLKHDYEKDLLKRKPIAKEYVKFINQLKNNHTIALDSPWGSGKSTFIGFMIEEFESQKDIYIKYNAWENDYTNEPFLSLMSEFFNTVEEKKYIGKDELVEIKTNTFNAVKLFGKSIVKATSRLILGSDAMNDFGDGIKEVAKALTEESSEVVIDKVFSEITDSKLSRKEFTIKLQETTSKILAETGKEKLIFIIDELDRCKPTFAIELLENIKHLFEINEIIFLIAVDRTQLSESIKAVYGTGFDSDTYLHRFFDIELHLQKKLVKNFFIKRLEEVFEDDFFDNNEEFKNFIVDSTETFDLTLRDIQRIVSETLLISVISNSKLFNNNVCIALLILKYKIPLVFKIIDDNKTLDLGTILHRISSRNDSQNFAIIFSRYLKSILSNDSTLSYLSEQTKFTLKLIKSTL